MSGREHNYVKKEDRRLIIAAEMAKIGMDTFNNILYIDKMIYYYSQKTNKFLCQDPEKILKCYLESGYPSLREVVRVLSSHTRIALLQKVSCWKPCHIVKSLEFVAGTCCFPNTAAFERNVLSERERRKSFLQQEVSRISQFSIFQLNKRNTDDENDSDDGYMNKYDCDLLFGADNVLKSYVEDGIGEMTETAKIIVMALRYQEANIMLQSVGLPLGKRMDIFRRVRSSEKASKMIKTLKCDGRIISFLLGSEDVSLEDLVTKLVAEKANRQHSVKHHEEAWDVDLKAISRSSDTHKALANYVDWNIGNVETIFSRYVLKINLEKNKLPSRARFIDKVSCNKQLFDEYCADKKNGVCALVNKLKQEQDSRYEACLNAISCFHNNSIDLDREQELLIQELRNKSKTSDFVRYGIGNPADFIHSINKGVQVKILKKTYCGNIFGGNYLKLKMVFDDRCNQIIEDKYNLAAVDLVALWKEEENLRKQKIETLLQKYDVGIEQIERWDTPRKNYFAYIQGTSHEKMEEVPKKLSNMCAWDN